MKLKSLITLTSLVGVVSPSLCLSGCTRFEPIPEPEDESARQYIYDRTFSIMAKGKDKSEPKYHDICWGTGWIINDATLTVHDDYCYWIATNWHVRDGMEDVELQTTDFNYYYGRGDSLYWGDDYTPFITFEWEEATKFEYDGDDMGWIDFMVAKVDFGTSESIPYSIKESLDNLNLCKQTYGHITAVADAWSTTSSYEKNRTYVGGYPVHGENAEWEYHCIDNDWLQTYDMYSEASHLIADYFLIDVSPQYTMKETYRRLDDWMDGGASGSMLVSKIDNEFKVIGIYWGGFLMKEGSKEYQPSFSIFNSTHKDFIGYYLKQNIG